MALQLTHADIRELLGAYAIYAVEDDEATLIESHLTECPRCRGEVAEYREAATLLSFPGTGAPEGVWSHIAAGLEDTPPPLSILCQLPVRRAPLRLFAAAAATAAVVAAGLGFQVMRQNDRVSDLAALSDRHGLAQAAAAATVTTKARSVRLQSNDGKHVVDAVVLPDGHGYLVRIDLPKLALDQTYQLWGVIGAQTISLGVIGDTPSITPFRAVGPLTALAITVEHTGGAVAPTTSPVVQGFLTVA